MKLLSATTTVSSVNVLSEIDLNAVMKHFLNDISGKEDIDDGFYVCDLGDVVAKHQRWLREFPRIRPFYAIKCNPDPTMLKTLLALGTGFDCASKAEIRQMLALGAKPEQIIYANPCKQSSHIRFARDNDVKLVVFDNEEELVKTKKNFPNAHLVLRIVTDDSASVCRFSMKYGAEIEACRGLIDAAQAMGFQMAGISFHVGSGCRDADSFVKALKNARMLFDYAETVGYHFTLLDIGGGFPGTEDVDLKFEEITSVVNQQLDTLFPEQHFPDLQVIAEPGRFYAASAFSLATNVIAKKKVSGDEPEKQLEDEKDGILDSVTPDSSDTAFMYYINDGLYGSFNCLFYDHAVVNPTVLKSRPSETMHRSSIWGPTCDGLDKIMGSVLLPELNVLDWIVWHDMGAYTIAAGCSFNGFNVTKIRYVISEKNLAALQTMMIEDSSLACVNFVGSQFIGKDHLCEKAALKKLSLFASEKETAEETERNFEGFTQNM